MCSTDCLLVLIAIVFPPLPVWVKRGLCSADSIINIALCVLGFVPGLIHSWYIISVTPDEYERYEYERVASRGDLEAGNARGANVYYVQMPGQHMGSQPQPRHQQPSYGTANESSSSRDDTSNAPPSYSDAVKGDNKVQAH